MQSNILRQLSACSMALLLALVLSFSSFLMLSSPAKALPLTLAEIPPAIAADSFVTAAVNRTGSSVVRIDTEAIVTRRFDPFFDDPFFREFFGDRLPQMPQEQRIVGQGSGFIVDGNGIILTNAHVVSKADKVTVTLKDGRTFNGEVRGTDEVTDLAVIKINAQGAKLPVAPLGDSSQVQVGDWAIAVGNPVGLDNTVTLGIISTIGRSAAKVGIPDKRVDFIQTDAAINPGNSGGPLLNAKGEVIGINTAIRPGAMGIGFAIPINQAKSLESLLATGKKVPHPYIGVQMINLTPELARQNNQNPNTPIILPEIEGVLVVGVLPNTPAQKSGIREGDVIVDVNNQRVTDGNELQSIVEKTGVDQTLTLKIQRRDRVFDVTVRTAQLESPS